ncbi:MAG: hypothetical protein ABI024_06875, partial [Vicinamibacterales bacterium]
MMMKHHVGRCAWAYVLTFSFIGPLAAQPAGQTAAPANSAQEAEDSSKGSKDVDRTVAYPMPQVLDAAKLA